MRGRSWRTSVVSCGTSTTKDPKAAIAFYTEVVGWKTQPFEGSDYMMWATSQGPMGGVMKLPDEAAKMGAPPHWMGHVEVSDVDATAANVKKLGGRIYKEPTGASFSVFKPSSTMQLHDMEKEGEFCWNELIVPDSAAAFKFYSQVFGWKISREMDMGPMGTYRIFAAGDKDIGGMMNTPKGSPIPPAWLYYTQTRDLDAAIKRATGKGAKLMNGPMDIPGGAKIAQLTDPQGAAFALHQNPKK
jgi:predicted enzyme related to lactoylglutathione lyase